MAVAQDMLGSVPLPSEKLSEAIPLPSCPGNVVISEWRPDNHVPWTRSTPESVQRIDQACALMRRYSEFLTSKGYEANQQPVNISISLLPANTLLDGSRPRAMNDGEGRFNTVTPHGQDGKRYVIWGVYDMETGIVFVRNDPVMKGGHENRYFTRIFLHEMAHALNDKWGVQARYFPGDKNQDEKLVEEWTSWIGYGFRDDSSFDDCYRKGFGDDVCIK
jgi:hypothetical protein